MERIILKDDEAKKFYHEKTGSNLTLDNHEPKFTNFGKECAFIGGYFESEINGVYLAYDFTNGEEVFIEEFDNTEEAKKYASGIEARTKDGTVI